MMMPDLLLMSEFMRLLTSLTLVLLAILISRWQALDLEKQMLVAVGRAFVQLTLIGYALTAIFAQDNLLLVLLIITIMTVIAGYTSGQRARGIPHARWLALLAIGVGTTLTLGLLIALQVFALTAATVIPIAGMIIGNAMNVCSLVMRRIQEEFNGRRQEIETALALGATSRQAAEPYLKTALQSGLMPIIDSTRTVGLIQLPGAMTGMILAGASPIAAVQLQIIVMYMLIGAAAFTGLVAAFLAYRQFFSATHQLVLPQP